MAGVSHRLWGTSLSSWVKRARPLTPDNLRPSPRSHSTTHCAFSLILWESPLHPGASCLAAFCPPDLCPSWAPLLRSVLSRRRLLLALECVPLEGCLPFWGFAPSPFGALASPSPEDRGFILSPHPVFYCSHPWPVGLTRHCAWRRMECGGVGVGGGFPFTFWLANFNVLAHPSPVFARCPPTPGSLQLCWVLHPSAASHRSPCYCTICRSGQR